MHEDLPQALASYVGALTGALDIDELDVLDAAVSYSPDGKRYTEGIEAVRALIKARRQHLAGAQLRIARVDERGDGCVEVDYAVLPAGTRIELEVPAVYELAHGKIVEICEPWPDYFAPG
jgi:limonene-1,2-epoxide hydrolase